jgi:CO/xanthine dehydrogenase Mo-binding subunit
VHSGATEIGTGAVSVALGLIAAQVLEIDPSLVLTRSGATAHGAYDFGSLGSRTAYGVGTAVSRAAQEVRSMLVRHFAASREVAQDDVVWRDGMIYAAGNEAEAVSLAALGVEAGFAGGAVIASARFQPDPVKFETDTVTGWQGALNEPTYHCHGVEIEVDEATGRVDVLRYVAAHDMGFVLNPQGARGQVAGGVLQGIGYALSEEMVSDDEGRVLNTTLHDYRVPTIRDIPGSLEIHLSEGHSGMSGYRGLKGIGEAPIIPVAAALGSAVRDATGRRSVSTSMTPERVLRLLDDEGKD